IPDEDFAIHHLPSLGGEARLLRPVPALVRLAVPEQLPALRLFGGADMVRDHVADVDIRRGRGGLEVRRLDLDVPPRGLETGLLRFLELVNLQRDESTR